MTQSNLSAPPAKRVRLIEQPDGYLSHSYPMTVGAEYDVVGHMGSCLVTTCDVPGETVSVWRGRFAAVN